MLQDRWQEGTVVRRTSHQFHQNKVLSSVSVAKVRDKRVFVVYFDPASGEIDWPENPNQQGGCLVVPRPCKTSAEWQVKYGSSK